MNDQILPPHDLTQAVAALWQLEPLGPNNLFSVPAFVRLREICQRLYPKAGSKDALSFALSNALRTFGLPSGLAPHNADLALPVDVAAASLDEAFRRTQSTRVHLCPLDCADDLPALSFGHNCVRRMSAAELDALVDPPRLKRINPTWVFDANRFAEFSWLVVKEVVPLDGEPGARAVPALFMDMRRDFGEIEPHKKRFTGVVEAALFALLLLPWEDWAKYRDLDWRGFLAPWIYTVDDDIFVRPSPPPSPETLHWEPDIRTDQHGEEIELDRPTCLPLGECSAEAPAWLNDTAWSELMFARQSPLFGSPIAHFLVRAFLTEGIDEFLAHITVVEAALGLSIDQSRPKLRCGKKPTATNRVAARLSTLLGESMAFSDFKRLFRARSEFLHGRSTSLISSNDRILARRLARGAVATLIKAALAIPAPSCRKAYLDKLLDDGSDLLP